MGGCGAKRNRLIGTTTNNDNDSSSINGMDHSYEEEEWSEESENGSSSSSSNSSSAEGEGGCRLCFVREAHRRCERCGIDVCGDSSCLRYTWSQCNEGICLNCALPDDVPQDLKCRYDNCNNVLTECDLSWPHVYDACIDACRSCRENKTMKHRRSDAQRLKEMFSCVQFEGKNGSAIKQAIIDELDRI